MVFIYLLVENLLLFFSIFEILFGRNIVRDGILGYFSVYVINNINNIVF